MAHLCDTDMVVEMDDVVDIDQVDGQIGLDYGHIDLIDAR